MKPRALTQRNAYLRERYYSPMSGDYRGYQGPGTVAFNPAGRRYCETCCTYQPRQGKAVKGWKCANCRLTRNP